jgi:hypothetical protein
MFQMIPTTHTHRETCRICDAGFIRHDDLDCCTCCGMLRGEVDGEAIRGNCGLHGHWCEHWQYMYFSAIVKRAQCLDGIDIDSEADLIPVLVAEGTATAVTRNRI